MCKVLQRNFCICQVKQHRPIIPDPREAEKEGLQGDQPGQLGKTQSQNKMKMDWGDVAQWQSTYLELSRPPPQSFVSLN